MDEIDDPEADHSTLATILRSRGDRIRAELDAYYARLYDLTRDELRYAARLSTSIPNSARCGSQRSASARYDRRSLNFCLGRSLGNHSGVLREDLR